MNETEIKQLLDTLAENLTRRDLIELNKQLLIEDILTPEIKARIQEIETEFADKINGVNNTIAELETVIKKEVIEYGNSVEGMYLHAIYNGKITWDTKSLDGYVKAHPELLEFCKRGEPSVSIRRI